MEKSTAEQPARPSQTERSEQAFLAGEAAAAQKALGGTLERMRADLGASADLSAWARKYPWPTIGAAAALGFLTTVAIGSPPARRPEEAATEKTDAASPKSQPSGAGQDRGLLYSLLSELLRNLATAAQAALLAAIASRFSPPASPAAPGDPTNADPTGGPSETVPSGSSPSQGHPSGNGAAASGA